MILQKINLCIIVHKVLFIVISSTNNLDDLKYFDRRKPEFETFLMPSDFAMASTLDDDVWEIKNDWVLYSSGKFEGDMDLDVTNLGNVNHNADDNELNPKVNVLYNAVRNRHLLWPASRIPYAMSSQYSPYSRSVIAAAMEEYAQHTCVRWVPRSVADYDYIYIVPDRGCYSMVGKTGGKQTVSLGTGCIQKGIIMHELMHAVGFFHEQSRIDRDNYVTILWENIQSGMQGQFEKYNHGIIDSLGVEYDYDSIMHYGERAFSRNGQPTLIPKRPVAIGQRSRFSTLDSLKINKLYKCPLSSNQTKAAKTQSLSTTDKELKLVNATIQLIIDSCRNIRSDCDELVAYGWCAGNPRWMRQYCTKSCNMCANATIPPCTDQRPDCFALVKNSHCIISGEFMHVFCTKSCGFCNITETVYNTTATTTTGLSKLSTSNTVTPITTKTARKKSRPKQSSETTWMKFISSMTNTTEASSNATCTDRKRFCIHWKNAGFCKGLFHSFMMENCKKSCKICTVDE